MIDFADTRTLPTFNYPPSSPNQTYTLLFIDLSLPGSRADPSQLDPEYQLPPAPGYPANRTTRLHFWQAGITFDSEGTLVNSSEPVAFYQGPSPPPGDIPHVYVFYLYEQEEGFAPPPDDSPFNVNNVNAESTNRLSFNAQSFGEQSGVGDLVAANYIQVQNTTGTATSSAGASTGSTPRPTSTGPTSSPSPFTGTGMRLGVVDAWKVLVVLTGGAAMLLS